MLDFELYVPTRMIFGRGRCDEVGRVIAGYGAAKPLVCYGGGSVVKSGLLERVERSLRQAGVDYALLVQHQVPAGELLLLGGGAEKSLFSCG